MAVVIELAPVLEAADKVLVPSFDLTDADEGMAADVAVAAPWQQAALPLVRAGGEVPTAGAAGEQDPAPTRRPRVRAPRRRAADPPAPRLVDAEGHASTAFEAAQSDTRWGRCFSCRRALRPSVSRLGHAMLVCSKQKPADWRTRLQLTPQQADALDFPRVLRRQVRILW